MYIRHELAGEYIVGRKTQPTATQENTTPVVAEVTPVSVETAPAEAAAVSDPSSVESVVESAVSGDRSGDVQPNATQEVAPSEVWDLLNGEFGELPGAEDLKLDGFYKDLRPEHIRDLPTPAKQIIHNLRRANQLARAEADKAKAQLDTDIEAKRQELYQKEKDLLRREQEFAALVDDPNVQAQLKVPDGELPDPFTQEGVEARIQKATAERFKAFIEPFRKSAEDRRRELAWMEFVESNPELRDDAFRTEMGSVIEERKKAGAPVTTQDAFKLVKLNRLEKAEQQRQAKERVARTKSASKVARTTATGNPSHQDIPEHARKNAATLYNYLKDNEEAKRRIDALR
jgi:hypothetical protein